MTDHSGASARGDERKRSGGPEELVLPDGSKLPLPRLPDPTGQAALSPELNKAWTDYMVSGTSPAAGKCDTAALDKVMALAHKLNIRGTPAIFLADGSRVPGFMPAARLEEAMKHAAEVH
jgi:hypothetical protein